MRRQVDFWIIGVLIAITASYACTSVPKEVVSLSAAVEERITATEASHEAFVSQYFEASRVRIEDFLQYVWIPAFLDDFVSRAELMDRLSNPEPLDAADVTKLSAELKKINLASSSTDQVVAAVKRALGDSKRGQTVLDFADAAMGAIATQRRELMTPLDSREAHALEQLRANYAELMSMQKTISAYLQSVEEVSEIQEEALRKLKLQDDRDKIIRGALDLNQDIAKAIERGESAADSLEKLKTLLLSN